MMKRIMKIAILAVIIACGEVWFMPHHLSAQTNAPSASRKILYYTCPMHPSVKSDKPGSCPICGMSLEPVYGNDLATNSAPSNGTNSAASSAQPTPYPLDTCVVDAMKLGSMGDPYVFVYEGQEIKLCCASCKPIFLKNPDLYMKKIQDAEARK